MTITKERGGKLPVYVAEPGKRHFFGKRKLGIGIVPNGACTNKCIFCGPEENAIQETYPETPIVTPKKFPIVDYLTEVRSVIEKEQINPACTMGIGNDYNDLELLEFTRFSYLVENSPEEWKRRFSVTKSNEENAFSVSVSIHL